MRLEMRHGIQEVIKAVLAYMSDFRAVQLVIRNDCLYGHSDPLGRDCGRFRAVRFDRLG
jgi:hypothetical protein